MSEGNAPIAPLTLVNEAKQVSVDEERQKRIRAILRASNWMSIVLLVPTVALEILLLLLCLPTLFIMTMTNPWLMLQPVAGWYPLRILPIYFFSVALLLIILFPLTFVLGYVLPRCYKLQRFTFSVWLSRWLRAARRMIVNCFCLAQCFFLLFVLQPNIWWLWMALLLTLVSVSRAYFAPLYAFRHLKRTHLVDEHLVNMLNKLCKANKTHIQHFFLLESKKTGRPLLPNAYLAGWGTKSSILLPDSLLKLFTPAEIRVIIAHELGHHVHRHVMKKQLLNALLLLVELFLYYTLYHWLLSAMQSSAGSTNANIITYLFLGSLALCIWFSFFMARRRYRQHHEFWADEFALRATRDVQAFKNAMLRLGNLNDIPFKLTPSQERNLTHPTTMRRWQHADEFAVRLARARAANRQG